MKSNKGFTLIELLAVIVILAIVALVATPVILNIIKDSKDKADEADKKLVVNSISMAYSTQSVKLNGEKPTLAQVKSEFKDIMDNVDWTDAVVDPETNATKSNTKITTNNGVECEIKYKAIMVKDAENRDVESTTETKMYVDCGDNVVSKDLTIKK